MSGGLVQKAKEIEHKHCALPDKVVFQGNSLTILELLYMLALCNSRSLFVTPRTVAHQAPPSMGFSMQEYWSGLPFPSPGDLPDPGIRVRSVGSPALQADSLLSQPPEKSTLHAN